MIRRPLRDRQIALYAAADDHGLVRKYGWAAAAASLVYSLAGTAYGQGAQAASPPGDATEVPGLDISVRAGFELPLGALEKGIPLSDGLSGAIPLVFEAGVRGNRNVSIGFSLERAWALTRNCSGLSCSATDYRLNAEAIFTYRTDTEIHPWVGVGIGYEWLDLTEDSSSARITGWTYGVIQAGAESRLDRRFGLGPFVSFSVGEYSSESFDFSSRDITNQTLHAWLQFGLRGTANL